MYTSIVQDLKSLLISENILKHIHLIKEIEEKFNLINHEETKEDINKLLAQDLLSEIGKKIKQQRKVLKIEEENLKTKKEDLIEQLSELINNEENIGRAFSSMKVIREQWNKESKKGAFKLKDLDTKFSKLIEDFYYNINIYKAIHDHDLKRNQQLKTSILEKLEACTKQIASRNLMGEIKELRNEWEGVGPIKKEAQKEYWNNYHNFLERLYNNFNEYKASEKEEQLDNLKEKNKIITLIKAIDISQLKSNKAWKTKTDIILDNQKKWKGIGYVPSENKNEIWNDYKNICDDFFKNKKSFYDEEKEKYKTNKKLKLEICKTAEIYRDYNDLNEANNKFILLQKNWKSIGPVHQKDEQFLWHKFQKSCNTFFERKKNASKLANQERDIVNAEKETLITSLNQSETDLKIISYLYIQWLKTERIHTKKSNDLKKEFNQKLELILKKNKTTLEEFTSNNFNQKIEIYKTFENNEDIIRIESSNLKSQLDKIKKEIKQYENNLGFFDNSKETSKLILDVQVKITNYKLDVIEIQKKLKLLLT